MHNPLAPALTFAEHTAQLPVLLQQLEACAPLTRAELTDHIPKGTPGIYAFYLDSGEQPIYIGRTRNLLRRLREHGAEKSTHFSASFAFLRARREAERLGHDLTGRKRAELAKDEKLFKGLFDNEKTAVARMRIRWVKVDHPVTQALFEVYAALTFNTPFNSFETS